MTHLVPLFYEELDLMESFLEEDEEDEEEENEDVKDPISGSVAKMTLEEEDEDEGDKENR